MSEVMFETLEEPECMRLIAPGGIGRLAFAGRYDLTVLPVNYMLHEGAIFFRTTEGGPTEQDLRTGIAGAEYRVAFEIDDFDPEAHDGWSVLVQGRAHHLDAEDEQADARAIGLEAWPPGPRDQFIRITPVCVTGRRISHQPDRS